MNDDDDTCTSIQESMLYISIQYNMFTNSHYTIAIATHPHNHILYSTHSHSRRTRSKILCYIICDFFLAAMLFLFFIRRYILNFIHTHSMHKYVRGCFTANHHHLISAQLSSSFVRILTTMHTYGVNNSWMSAFDACHKCVYSNVNGDFRENSINSRIKLNWMLLFMHWLCLHSCGRECVYVRVCVDCLHWTSAEENEKIACIY